VSSMVAPSVHLVLPGQGVETDGDGRILNYTDLPCGPPCSLVSLVRHVSDAEGRWVTTGKDWRTDGGGTTVEMSGDSILHCVAWPLAAW